MESERTRRPCHLGIHGHIEWRGRRQVSSVRRVRVRKGAR